MPSLYNQSNQSMKTKTRLLFPWNTKGQLEQEILCKREIQECTIIA